MRDSEKIKVIEPYRITLYTRQRSPYIYYSFSLDHKQFRGSTETSDIIQATMRAEEIYWDIRHGKTTIPINFSSVVKRFLKYKKARVSPNTYSDYERQSRFLVEKFKRKDIDKITKADFYSYEEWRRTYYSKHQDKKTQHYSIHGKRVKGREYEDPGNTIINRELGLLVSILRYAQKELGLLSGKTIPSWTKLKENTREDVLTRAEYQKLKNYWMKHNPFYWSIIAFVQNTGLRYPSEVDRLRVKDVNLRKSYVIIRDRKRIGTTAVPLVGTSKEIIEHLLSRKHLYHSEDDYVFIDDTGKRVKNIRRAFKNSIVKCGIKKHITMYSLRHTFTTRLLRTRPDIPIKAIAQILGHKDTRIIDKHYGHLRIGDLVHIVERSEENRQRIKLRKKG